jgi:peptidyl-prolyl cis-trans isomerase B (cyclophilin B)
VFSKTAAPCGRKLRTPLFFLKFQTKFYFPNKNSPELGIFPLFAYFCALSQSTTMKTAEIHTEKGVMKVQFFEEDAPGTVANFLKLAGEGFYDGLTFHRVIPDFVIQGGCPHGTGTGGPGYKIKCETSGGNQYHDRGVLSMAHAGRDTGGSQFFICHNRQNTQHLDGVHTVFGKVYEGLDVIDDIRPGDRIEKIVIID